ncbi:MAG: OmpA family protein [Candidatus Kapabacteria bacterium]|nr:OmpA family protein [Candidatus Kapabacteria bacterium]
MIHREHIFRTVRGFHLIVIASVLFILPSINAVAQSTDLDSSISFRFGGFAGGGIILHAAEFSSLNGFPSCCPLYTNGNGLTPNVGLFIELPMTQRISHSIRLSLSDLSGRFTTVESQPVDVSGTLREAKIEHSLSTVTQGIALEPTANFRVGKTLTAFTGIRADFSLKGVVSQKEELLFPEQGSFENGSRIRNTKSGDIVGLSPLVLSAVGGFRLSFPMNADNTLLLMPELSFSLGFTRMTISEDWRAHAVRAGIGVAFQSLRSSAPNKMTMLPPSIKSDLSVIPFNGERELPGTSVSIIETELLDMQPLMPYIFFEHGSEALPSRYVLLSRSETAEFSPERAIRNTSLETYYNVLNIIGSRLAENTKEVITITGTTADSADERDNTTLARRRAENIARYFQSVWKIDRKRMIIQTIARSADTTRPLLSAAECRRVEIHGSPVILSSLVRRDTVRSISPDYLRFRPAGFGNDDVKSWELVLTQRNATLKTVNGKGTMPLKTTLDMRDIPGAIRLDSLQAVLVVNGESGLATSSIVQIPTSFRPLSAASGSSDTTVIRAWFSFPLQNSTNLTLDSTQRESLSLLNRYVTNESIINITDFTKSAPRTAELVASRLRGGLLRSTDESSSPFYSVPYPEARFLNRGVLVTVRNRNIP